MEKLSEKIKTGDFKKEKHSPIIEAPDKVGPDEIFQVKLTLGTEIAHPNKTEHHISWMSLYYHDEQGKFVHQVAHVEFTAHGESVDGPDQGPVYTHHEAVASMKISRPGVLHAMAYCNIHGLWETTKPIGLK